MEKVRRGEGDVNPVIFYIYTLYEESEASEFDISSIPSRVGFGFGFGGELRGRLSTLSLISYLQTLCCRPTIYTFSSLNGNHRRM